MHIKFIYFASVFGLNDKIPVSKIHIYYSATQFSGVKETAFLGGNSVT